MIYDLFHFVQTNALLYGINKKENHQHFWYFLKFPLFVTDVFV